MSFPCTRTRYRTTWARPAGRWIRRAVIGPTTGCWCAARRTLAESAPRERPEPGTTTTRTPYGAFAVDRFMSNASSTTPGVDLSGGIAVHEPGTASVKPPWTLRTTFHFGVEFDVVEAKRC